MNTNWTTLVDAPALSAALGDPGLRLVDARFVMLNPAPDAGRQAYAESHLPGAVYADLNLDLSDLSKVGEGRHPLPDSDVLARRLGEWGIGPAHQVVVYDAGDGSMAAARLWWLLWLMGHPRVAVLDGGLAAWRAMGGEETAEVATPAPVAAYPSRMDARQLVSADEVLDRLDEDSGWLVDARAAERFRGDVEPIDPVAGHVPGALNRPFAQNLREGRFKPAEELGRELSSLLGARAPGDTVLMCGSGVTACHLLLAFEHAGLHGARVYPGSWSGWISDPSRPVARGD
ncbi:thiosulfate/3-mercaptopyruvate sulfurtransferase [Pseudoxanthomonas sp. 3HH-4]|uniref:sulfurtransferase n=1 Tax=Pseudoxanthomonas sp. 3HH-4 TaxID=1690214 RepID=UPI0011513233|nr:sulfurtransferase [Pseudoxanthomonas sp. 3HH-4]TQM17878.1 thiosulfate/3-mercaptopyruvate sulfurtransferase [Pseudoxanthomonas sp. 3HH-4]